MPFLLGAAGPKGIATARELGAGVFMAGADATAGFDHEACLMFGTVVDDADDLSSERVMAAAGHGAAVYYHFWFENGRSMADLPRGEDWLAAYADIPADVRHLAVHDRHLIGVNDRDRAFVTPEILQAMGATFRPEELRERLGALADLGHDGDRLPARRAGHPARARGLRPSGAGIAAPGAGAALRRRAERAPIVDCSCVAELTRGGGGGDRRRGIDGTLFGAWRRKPSPRRRYRAAV